MGCLDQSTLARLHGEQLGEAERARVRAHLAGCEDCRDLSAAVHLSIVGRVTSIHRATDRGTPPRDIDARPTEEMGATLAHVSGAADPSASDPAAESSPGQAPHLWAGDSVDHYEVLLLLGRGAMGEVYLAQDTKLGRKVALKLMRPEMFKNEEAARRFQNEARAMAQINHPNVVTIHAVGEYRDVPYVAMEFVRGQSLFERLDGGLDDDECLRIAIAVASALREAHELGIVHRDLKPENVIAARDGAVSVLDFGLAKTLNLGGEDSFADTPMPSDDVGATRLGSRVGTPLYMSPEQWRSGEITTATDVWAFGVLLFEMHTGQVPFRGVDLADLARKVCDPDHEPPVATDIPPAIQAVIARCLRREPAERPTISQVITTLDEARDASSSPPRPSESEPWQVSESRPSRRWPLVAGAVALLVGGVAIGWALGGEGSDTDLGAERVAAPAAAVSGVAPAATTAALDVDAPEVAPSASATAADPPDASPPMTVPAPRPPPSPRPPRPRPKPAGPTKDPFSEPPSNAGY